MNEKDIDKYVGQRLRLLRELQGFSQGHIGKNTGVSFQQIQKYETGKNRLKASRIYQISNILEVSPLAFFEGLPGILLKNPTIIDPKTVKIANLIQTLDDPVKKTLEQLIKSIV